MSSNGKFRRQKGQTLALVAVAMVSFIAMAALAIDLTSLYSAHSEIQRAADATALAGAKAFVDSGVTTDPRDSNLRALAGRMAVAYASAAAAQNLVANAAPQFVGTPSPDFSHLGNPTITVTLQRTDLPLFFSHIWSGNFGTVSATATAEAYNPAFSQNHLPSAPKCVKPILVPNLAPSGLGSVPFVDVTSGQVTPGKQFIGTTFDLGPPRCNPSSPGCSLRTGAYLPLLLPPNPPHQYCPLSSPGCGGTGPNPDYKLSMECCDGTAFNAPQCGTGAKAAWNPNVNIAPSVSSGLKCLIHTTGGSTPDSLDLSALKSSNGVFISPGSLDQTRYGLASTDNVLTSDSIITVPLFDSNQALPPTHQVTIVGFLTLFVNNEGVNPGRFGATILNVTGCGNNPSAAAPVSGGGVSSIPVRLIHN